MVTIWGSSIMHSIRNDRKKKDVSGIMQGEFPEAHRHARENATHDIELRHLLLAKAGTTAASFSRLAPVMSVVLDIRHCARRELPLGSLG